MGSPKRRGPVGQIKGNPWFGKQRNPQGQQIPPSVPQAMRERRRVWNEPVQPILCFGFLFNLDNDKSNLKKTVLHDWKELFAFWTKTYCLQGNFALCTNAFCTLDKYILPFGQIHFVGVTSEWDPWTCNGSISPSVAMFQLVVRLEVNYWPFRPVDGRIWGLYWAPDSQIHLLTNCSFQNIGIEKMIGGKRAITSLFCM